MILYSVTVNIENDTHQEWLQWMKQVHIPDVMNTGLFKENKVLRLLTEVEGNTGTTYSVQYLCENMDKYYEYEKKHAPSLQAVHHKRYVGKYVAFRTLLEVL